MSGADHVRPSRLKILWIARTCPFPPNDGEKLRVFNLLKALSDRHDLTVVYRAMEPEEASAADELRRYCRGGVHGISVPRPRNVWQRLRWLLPFLLSRYPVSLCTVFFKPILLQLRQLAQSCSFDIVQVEHSSLAIYLDHLRFSGRPATVLTMHNIDYVRNERVLLNTPWGLSRLYQWLNQSRFKRWELGALDRFDQVIAMSDVDRGMLLAEKPGLPVQVVPNGVDVSSVPFLPAPATAENVVFVASMDSEANHDGAMFFLREVWPEVRRKNASARVQFVGRDPQPALQAAHNGRDVVVTGRVDGVLGFYRQAAVAIVPLRSGGGTRLKILEAMSAGTPVVSTSVGCEGLDVAAGRDILIADAPQEFAAAVLRLLSDDRLRRTIAEEGRRLVEKKYDWRLIGEQHDAVYRQAMVGAQ